ncbi:hypothetical protein PV416_35655 [Streptomyces ipomoeae]|uniref:hypothetical protein n=1 Tax=Streptomyces ipomoeae TaxID=103232 RepID=UPI0029AC7FA3|nr:hypothetical protein [Streptomyces ipomoeae]MDX2826264.1 hypothetical protein [Streptomyces ipomoeae]MDX2878966.1 hypothetical protein [Streptomyces ipomoeae]
MTDPSPVLADPLRKDDRNPSTDQATRPPQSPQAAAADSTPPGLKIVSAAGLLILACITPLYNAVLAAGAMYDVQWTPNAVRPLHQLQFYAAVIVFWWLCLRVIARTTLDRVPKRQRLLQRGAAVLAGAAAIIAAKPTTSLLEGQAGRAVYACVLAWLTLEVCKAHGTPLDTSPRLATTEQRRETWQLTGQAFMACVNGGAAAGILVIVLRFLDIDGIPVLPGDQMFSPGADQQNALGHSSLGFVLGAIFSVAIEDVVIVGATTALMTAARRPPWQIYTTVCVIEVLLHAYFGLAAIGFILFATGRVRLFLRHRLLIPLMAGHAALDLLGPLTALPWLYRIPCLLLLTAVAWRLDKHLTRSTEPPDGDEAAVHEPPLHAGETRSPLEAECRAAGAPEADDPEPERQGSS